jgi:signal transduction histidine kinase
MELLPRRRRQIALNEALHELRRPLQVLALSAGPEFREDAPIGSSLRMAGAALERLEREINGRPATPAPVPLGLKSEVELAIARRRRQVESGGGSLRLRWRAGDAAIFADRGELGQVLDNLIDNALVHGGPRVVVDAEVGPGTVRVTVTDRGAPPRPHPRHRRRPASLARLAGRERHGHGLRVVRRIVEAHGGEFRLRPSAAGTEATVELPLLGADAGAA